MISTSVGYAGGFTQNPTYEEVCSGRTGHTEVVRIIYDPSKLSLESLLQVFWEKHDPTQGMRQGNDRGTQYRSAIYTYNDEQQTTAETTLAAYQQLLSQSGIANITTEIKLAGPYYLPKNTTSNIWLRIQMAIVGSAGRASAFHHKMTKL
ncbi:peptide methionine sulfoxide reductase msrA [Vibrio sp. JCM 19236]|nr:peptide methionine sulfoxide reductase msrA [Vibrio sp. JCM 19236]